MKTKQWLTALIVALAFGAAACSPEQSAETTSGAGSSDVTPEPDESTSPPGSAEEPVVDEEPFTPEPEPEPEPAGPVIAQIGDTLEVTQGSETVGTIAVTSAETSSQPYDEYGEGPKHKVFAIFDVTVDAKAAFDVYDGDFYVLTKDGTRYDLGDGNSYDAIDYDDALDWVELNAGEKKSGMLAFDLPVEHGKLAYAPNYDGGPIGIWKF